MTVDIDQKKLPQHIAIIMDGNGRWAKERNLERLKGHEHGSRTVINIAKAANHLGIKVLTLYAFSTENWKRPASEVAGLFKLLRRFIKEERETLFQEKICLKVMGNIQKIPFLVRREVLKLCRETEKNQGMILNIALSYGGREEILQAVKKILQEGKKTISEKQFSKFLYTRELPDPDLLIRSSGEQRISNFLLWQSAYTEFYFTDVLWPDFEESHLYEAIIEYQKRNRRYGAIITKTF